MVNQLDSPKLQKKNFLFKRLRISILMAICGFLGFLVAAVLRESNQLDPLLRSVSKNSFIRAAIVQPLRLHKDVIQQTLKENYRIPFNWINTRSVKVNNLNLILKEENLKKITLLAHDAVINNHIDASSKEEFPAKISFKGKEYKAKIRLKGDNIDHVQDGKWSFRVQLKNDEALMGMRTFSLQHPKTRNYIHEWLFQQALAKEDIIALRYEFVRLTLNGNDFGVYAIEEHFDKQLIESNRRRNGPILKFSEDLVWENLREEYSFETSETVGFKEKKLLESDESKIQYEQAMRQMHAFRNGGLSASEVFDVDLLSKYFALADMLGAQHALSWINIRFYYNPVCQKFEPIGYDGNAGTAISSLTIKNTFLESSKGCKSLNQLLFRDQKFARSYIKSIERLSKQGFLEGLLGSRNDELNLKLKAIYSSYPYFNYSLENYYLNRRKLVEALQMPQDIRAYLADSESGGLSIDVCNLQSIPVRIIGLTTGGKLSTLGEDLILTRAGISDPLTYTKICFPTLLVNENQVMIASYKLDGSETIKTQQVNLVKPQFSNLRRPLITDQVDDFSKFNFLKVNHASKIITWASGKSVVANNLFIPEGYTIKISSGAEIKLNHKCNIVSYSAVECVGTDKARITIEGDGSSGLTFLAPFTSARFERTDFLNLGVSGEIGWSNTGAVTFYGGNVNISKCNFIGSKSEDSLNIIRSKFAIRDSGFHDSKEDALDCDFSDGVLEMLRFEKCGNDAIDVSGSTLKISKCEIINFGDKGVSAGEGSNISIQETRINNGELGIASKDSSTIEGFSIFITNVKVALTSYNKKKEYGGSSLTFDKSIIENSVHEYYLESGSYLSLNGIDAEVNSEGLKSKYYGAEYGKKSDR
jgi:hypothetical protein